MIKLERETEKKSKEITSEEKVKELENELVDVKAALNDLILNGMGGI